MTNYKYRKNIITITIFLIFSFVKQRILQLLKLVRLNNIKLCARQAICAAYS